LTFKLFFSTERAEKAMRFPTISLITLAASGAGYYMTHQPPPPAPPPEPVPVAVVAQAPPPPLPAAHSILDAPKDPSHHSFDDLLNNK
jgi:hypothetical protein